MEQRSNHFLFYFVALLIIAFVFVPFKCSTDDPSVCFTMASLFMEGFLQVEFLTGITGYISVTILAIIVWYMMYSSLKREKPFPFIILLFTALVAYFVVPLFN